MSDNVKAAVERLRAVADSGPELSNGETYVLCDDLRAILAERDALKAQVERARAAVDAVLLRGNGWPAAAREAAQDVLDALEGKS